MTDIASGSSMPQDDPELLAMNSVQGEELTNAIIESPCSASVRAEQGSSVCEVDTKVVEEVVVCGRAELMQRIRDPESIQDGLVAGAGIGKGGSQDQEVISTYLPATGCPSRSFAGERRSSTRSGHEDPRYGATHLR